jgi:glycosyltransferase 2 family protein
MSEAAHPQTIFRRPLFIVLRWLVALLLLALLFHFIRFSPLRAALSRVPPWLFLAVLLLYFLALTVAIAKWHMVVNAAGASLPFAASAQCFASGLFGDLFLPSVIGGDIARLAVGISRSPRPAAVVTGNVADRLLDAGAQVSLVLAGFILLPGALPLPLQIPARRILMFSAAGVLLALALLFFLHRPLLRGRSLRFRRVLAQVRHSLRSVSRRPLLLLRGFLLGLVIQSSYVLLTFFLSRSCGLELPLRLWFFAWPLAKFAALLPITQGGIGVRETAFVVLLVPFGAPAALVLATGIVWEGVIIAGGLSAGLAAFLLRTRKPRGPAAPRYLQKP